MKKLVILAVISTTAVVGWRALRSGDDAAPHGGDLVLDRIWIDHIPRNDRDLVSAFAAITEDPFGIFQTSSAWKGQHEMFRYEAHEGELRIIYPQSRDRERVRASATECSERDFDYCLELKGSSRGVKRYYSREDWVISRGLSADEIRARIAELAGTADQ